MVFQRIFTNNSDYDKYKQLPYIKDLAYIAKTFIFSDRANEGNWRMNPGKHGVKLYDFMSIELKFIEAAASEFGDNTIEEWLAEMRQPHESADIFSADIVRYASDDVFPSLIDYVYISYISWETALDLLWAAYIYAEVSLRLSGEEKWEMAKNNLYPMMQKNFGGSSKKYFNELPIIKNSEEAIEMMISRVSKIGAEPMEVPAANDSELDARIAELEAENESLRQQLEECQIDEDFEEIQWHDKVRLELLLRLMEENGVELNKVVKARVAEVMKAITSLPISTCKNYCTNRDLNTETHKEEILELNSKLHAIGISFIL